MTTTPYLIAAYIRVSTDEQAEQGISIPAQKSRLAAYCQAQGWEVYDYYIDDGCCSRFCNCWPALCPWR